MKVGEIVEHILSKDWLVILEINDNIIKCRTKKLEVVELYDFELVKKQ